MSFTRWKSRCRIGSELMSKAHACARLLYGMGLYRRRNELRFALTQQGGDARVIAIVAEYLWREKTGWGREEPAGRAASRGVAQRFSSAATASPTSRVVKRLALPAAMSGVRAPASIARIAAASSASASFVSSERVTQQHRDAEDRAVRIRDALAGDVRRGAVDRLVQAALRVAERRRGQHAERARQHRGFVGEDVAEHVLGDQHVEVAAAGGSGASPPRRPGCARTARPGTRLFITRSTTSRHRREVSSTFDLSMDVTFFRRWLRQARGHARDALDFGDRVGAHVFSASSPCGASRRSRCRPSARG